MSTKQRLEIREMDKQYIRILDLEKLAKQAEIQGRE